VQNLDREACSNHGFGKLKKNGRIIQSRYYKKEGSRDSAVGIAAGYGLDDRGSEFESN
jgi:hypothetical protein